MSLCFFVLTGQFGQKVADNCRTGKVKANRKKMRRQGCKFKDNNFKDNVNDSSNSTSLNKTTTTNVTASANSEDSVIDGTDQTTTNSVFILLQCPHAVAVPGDSCDGS